MYIRRQHQLTDQEALFSLIEANALGTWVCYGSSGLIANHIPFFLDRNQGPFGTLKGHVARANPLWRELDATVPSVVTFQGPQAYISPGWYPGKKEHGMVVPTWNYAVAHAHGTGRAIEDPEWLRSMLDQLTGAQEAGQPEPWQVNDAPPSYIDKRLRAIVGIEIPIDRLEGKLKASQEETPDDRAGIEDGLRKEPCDETGRMADLVMKPVGSDATS